MIEGRRPDVNGGLLPGAARHHVLFTGYERIGPRGWMIWEDIILDIFPHDQRDQAIKSQKLLEKRGIKVLVLYMDEGVEYKTPDITGLEELSAREHGVSDSFSPNHGLVTIDKVRGKSWMA